MCSFVGSHRVFGVGGRSDIQLKLCAHLILSSICVHYFMHAINRATHTEKPNHSLWNRFQQHLNNISKCRVLFLSLATLLKYLANCVYLYSAVCVLVEFPFIHRLSSCVSTFSPRKMQTFANWQHTFVIQNHAIPAHSLQVNVVINISNKVCVKCVLCLYIWIHVAIRLIHIHSDETPSDIKSVTKQ